MPPIRPAKAQGAMPAPKGTKKTFDDDDGPELDFQAESSSSRNPPRHVAPASDEDDDDASDDDDMPEAVGMGDGKSTAFKDLESAQQLVQAQRNAAKKRHQKIAESKAQANPSVKTTKRSVKQKRSVASDDESEEDEDEGDEETRRLRARMQKAMEAGEGDSDEESFRTGSEDGEESMDDDEVDGEEEEDGFEDDEGEYDGASFHTDSEGEDDEDEDEDEDDDDSEILEEGPIDAATRQMRERMQAAMEAAERRAGIIHPKSKSTGIAPSKQTGPKEQSSSSSKPSKRKAEVAENDDSMWDLDVGTGEGGPQPLSVEALRKGEEEEREIKRRKREKEALEAEKRKAQVKGGEKRKKRVAKEQTFRKIGGKTVQILQPTLDPSVGGLPPPIDAGSKVRGQAAGQASKNRFVKNAMKASGQIPGKSRVDGRRRPIGLERKV